METLILLLYYRRPEMVRRAIRSVASQTTRKWVLLGIDDNERDSKVTSLEVLIQEEMPKDLLGQCFTTYVNDDLTEKQRRGSNVGQAMNWGVLTTACDTAIMLCDDDALIPDYLEKAQRYFESHPEEMYAYSHVRIYDPEREEPGAHLPKRPYFTNREGLIYPSCAVDASQVMWRTKIHHDQNIRFPYPQTKDLDAHFYAQLGHFYGPGNFMGIDGQYKGIFADQLGQRQDPYRITVR